MRCHIKLFCDGYQRQRHDYVEQFCEERDCEFALSEVWEKGGEGGIALANKVLETLREKRKPFQGII